MTFDLAGIAARARRLVEEHDNNNVAAAARRIGVPTASLLTLLAAEGDLPSVEVVDGVVTGYQVDAVWLLEGDRTTPKESAVEHRVELATFLGQLSKYMTLRRRRVVPPLGVEAPRGLSHGDHARLVTRFAELVIRFGLNSERFAHVRDRMAGVAVRSAFARVVSTSERTIRRAEHPNPGLDDVPELGLRESLRAYVLELRNAGAEETAVVESVRDAIGSAAPGVGQNGEIALTLLVDRAVAWAMEDYASQN